MNTVILFFIISIFSGILVMLIYDMEKNELKRHYNKLKNIGDKNGYVPVFKYNNIGGVI